MKCGYYGGPSFWMSSINMLQLVILKSLPYITAEVKQLARQRDFLKKKYLQQAFQQIKNRVTYKLRSLRSEYYF